ncbi:MAG TPA: putative toxin-antitoxin system toxin component, PIN family [Rhodocyclaceae bacterium]|nr:putative toxin-antitoxin system toxin component, PIN family [Rhodocyclaceae bacterium]
MSPPRPLRIVFDTNVLLSMFVFADSRFAPLRAEVDAGRWLAYTRADCLDEFRRVLNYEMFKLEEERQAAAYAAYVAAVQHAPPLSPDMTPAPLPRCKDKDDQKFLELARDVEADWLVSSDKALLKLARKLVGRYRIIKPEQALKELAASLEAALEPKSGL